MLPLIILISSFLILWLSRNWLVRKMTYPAPWVSVSSPPPPLQEVLLSLPAGATVRGWLFQQPEASDSTPVVLFFHGNGENLTTMHQTGLFQDFQELQIHFLALDYPGYGKSTGKPSEVHIMQAAEAAIFWLKEQFPAHPLVVCGWSLGAAVAIQTAARHPEAVSGLIVLSAWSSLKDVARMHYPGWLVKILLTEQYASLEAAKNIHCPTLIIHGEADQIIPVTQGRQVANAIHPSPRWLAVQGTGHNDLLGSTEVWEEMQRFMDRLSKP